MQRRRAARERERWLSGVLIVTAIVGASAAVRFWPVSLPQRTPRPLASRALIVIDSPVLPISNRVLRPAPEPPDLPVFSPQVGEVVVAVADVSAPSPVIHVELRTSSVAPPGDDPVVLASRRLDLPLGAPFIAPGSQPVITVADDESHALMELPAVAVTRVVTVAGRGIRTGVRATTAVFRAAF